MLLDRSLAEPRKEQRKPLFQQGLAGIFLLALRVGGEVASQNT